MEGIKAYVDNTRLVLEFKDKKLLSTLKPIFIEIVKKMREHLQRYGMSFSDPNIQIDRERGPYTAAKGFYVDFEGDVQVIT